MLIADGVANCHVVCVISECQSPNVHLPLVGFIMDFSNSF